MMTKLKRWNAARKAANELSALSDKELNDIGISRCMIKHVIWQEAYRLYP